MTAPEVGATLPLGDEPGSSPATAVSVQTLNKVLKNLVEGAFIPLWVRGEVSDFKNHRNGHWYFSLRDASSQLRCVVWSRDQRRIPAAPDDGMQVAVYGQMTVFAARGEVQLTVKQIDAEGDGLWLKALEQTKARLEADGLLAPERKRPLPPAPGTIAVITSPDGAALHDIVHVVRKRAPATRIVVIPARVQGEGSAEELTAALALFERWRGADVLIIGRGGGAREDLWSFNDESLARALAACSVPTISAVGHEVDVTISDMVADYRAATPSAAAEAAVPAAVDQKARLRSLARRVGREMEQKMRGRAAGLSALLRQLPQEATRTVQRKEVALRSLAGRVNDLSPLAVMSRGFAVAQAPDGTTLGRAEQFAVGERFILHLRDGKVQAQTEEVTLSTEGKELE